MSAIILHLIFNHGTHDAVVEDVEAAPQPATTHPEMWKNVVVISEDKLGSRPPKSCSR